MSLFNLHGRVVGDCRACAHSNGWISPLHRADGIAHEFILVMEGAGLPSSRLRLEWAGAATREMDRVS